MSLKKYTQADIIDFVAALLITEDINLTKKDIKKFLHIYGDVVQNVLLSGSAVSIGRIGTIRFKTISAKPERPDLMHKGKTFPAHDTYSSVKLIPNNTFKDKLRDITLGDPYDPKIFTDDILDWEDDEDGD